MSEYNRAPIDMHAMRERRPPEPGIYPVFVESSDGTAHRSCAMWDGENWSQWVTMFDPPEWDPVQFHNCRVIGWRQP